MGSEMIQHTVVAIFHVPYEGMSEVALVGVYADKAIADAYVEQLGKKFPYPDNRDLPYWHFLVVPVETDAVGSDWIPRNPKGDRRKKRTMSGTCTSCNFYMKGECRRHPPTILAHVHSVWDEGNWNDSPTIGTTFDTRFPEVDGDDWCGEHRSASEGA